MTGADVSYHISRTEYWSWSGVEDEGYSEHYEDYSYTDYEDYGGYGEVVLEGTARTGPDGTAEIEFPARWTQGADRYYGEIDQQFTVYAVVADQSRRTAEGEAKIIATQGEFAVSVISEKYVSEPGANLRFSLLAAGYDSRPRPGVKLDVVASRTQWHSDTERYEVTASRKVSTDQTGRAEFSFKPEQPGSYVIRATCRDGKGNRISAASWVWVTRGGGFEGYRYPNLQIILDKKSYDPGDTAELLINCEEEGATALITVEGRRLFDYRLVKLESKSTVVEIPVKGEYRPNFYVDVCYVKNKTFISQQGQARVSLKQQTLTMTVTPDKKSYQPGDEATYLIKATDDKGRPAEAEVSLGVVDESIYAIRKENTVPIRDFFYALAWNAVHTRYSFPQIYLSGDKAAHMGKVRKNFVDTAFWRADVVTDSNGEARVKFKVPDNLTTWRATARAATLDTAVGQCTSSAVCSKNLIVRLETPRFLIQKDVAVISAIVHNYLPAKQNVEVRLHAPGLQVSGNLLRKVAIASKGVERVAWRVNAPDVGRVSLMARATCSAADDAMELEIPVRPHGQRQVETRAGEVFGRGATEKMQIREDSVAGASEIRVRLAPSLASALLGSLDYLVQYPYGCTEQTMSAFLPDVVIWRVLKSLGIDNPDLEKSLPDMVGKGLNRLYDFQNHEGGWGWSEYCKSDLWMTSYVVFGLLTAREAGFDVNQQVLQQGLDSLQWQLGNGEYTDERIYSLYVLSLAGRMETVKTGLKLALRRPPTEIANIALLSLTLANAGEQELANRFLAQVWERASTTGGLIHWSRTERWGSQSPAEIAGLALMAAIKLQPEDPRIPKVVRWVLKERDANHWSSTRDTAMVLYGLSDYLAKSKELQPEYTARVLHNGRKIAELRIDKNSPFQPEQEVVISARDVQTGDNIIRLETSSSATLYYTIELTQYVGREEIPRTITGSGITVSREYRKLVSRWSDKRSAQTTASSATTEFRSGDVVRVLITVNSPRSYRHVLVEDYLPAGCEAFDRGRLELWEWNYWWVDKDVRDERVSFYVESLPAGKSELLYEFRAGVPGRFHAMPVLVQAMYEPSISASGLVDRVRIR